MQSGSSLIHWDCATFFPAIQSESRRFDVVVTVVTVCSFCVLVCLFDDSHIIPWRQNFDVWFAVQNAECHWKCLCRSWVHWKVRALWRMNVKLIRFKITSISYSFDTQIIAFQLFFLIDFSVNFDRLVCSCVNWCDNYWWFDIRPLWCKLSCIILVNYLSCLSSQVMLLGA